MKLTEEEIQARIEIGRKAAEARRQERKERKGFIRNVRAHGIRFATFGRLTVAYQALEHSFVAFATSIRNPKDAEDATVGQANAALRLSRSIGAVVPVISDEGFPFSVRMNRTISEMFGHYKHSWIDKKLEKRS